MLNENNHCRAEKWNNWGLADVDILPPRNYRVIFWKASRMHN
jgi:hypothetical protein